MSRNSSGTMSATNGPYTSGTTIVSAQINSRFSDVEAELTSSLDRQGRGGMQAPLRGVDGTVAAPAVSFTSEPGSGLYKAGTGDVRLAVGGVDAVKLVAGGVNDLNIPSAGQGNVAATATNATLALSGNRSAADPNVDVYIQNPNATRTAGYIADFRHGGGDKLLVDYQGLLRLGTQAAPLQPASIWTAITPNASWSAVNGWSYLKDATGVVRFRGGATNGTGSAASSIIGSSPLPVGFRPSAQRTFVVCDAAGNAYHVGISATGTAFTTAGTIPNGGSVLFDGISFLAEQ